MGFNQTHPILWRTFQAVRVLALAGWGAVLGFIPLSVLFGGWGPTNEPGILAAGALLGGMAAVGARKFSFPGPVGVAAGIASLAGIVTILAKTRTMPPADEMGPYVRMMMALYGVGACVAGWLLVLLVTGVMALRRARRGATSFAPGGGGGRGRG